MADLFQPSAAELRDRFLRDARLAAIDAGGAEPPTEPGSDWHILGTGLSGPLLLGFANINAAEQAWDVLNATGEDLDAIRVGYGLPEIPPSGSRGKIRLTIAGPTTIPKDRWPRVFHVSPVTASGSPRRAASNLDALSSKCLKNTSASIVGSSGKLRRPSSTSS
jgi:hypothetical protein